MSFEPITTQEQLDGVIGERLEREREKVRNEVEGKYSDYQTIKDERDSLSNRVTTLEGDITAKDTKISELNSKVAKYESDSVKTRIAKEYGLPDEIATRLTGEKEEDLRKDAESLSKVVKQNNNPAPPFFQSEKGATGGKDSTKREALRNMLQSMKGE